MEMIHLMTKHPETVGPTDTLEKAKEIMAAGGFRRLPVEEEGRVVGILTERDLRGHVGYLKQSKVDAAMSTGVVTVGPHATVEEGARLMLQHKIGGLPIVDRGKLIGIVTASDMLRALLEVVEAAQKSLTHESDQPQTSKK